MDPEDRPAAYGHDLIFMGDRGSYHLQRLYFYPAPPIYVDLRACGVSGACNAPKRDGSSGPCGGPVPRLVDGVRAPNPAWHAFGRPRKFWFSTKATITLVRQGAQAGDTIAQPAASIAITCGNIRSISGHVADVEATQGRFEAGCRVKISRKSGFGAAQLILATTAAQVNRDHDDDDAALTWKPRDALETIAIGEAQAIEERAGWSALTQTARAAQHQTLAAQPPPRRPPAQRRSSSVGRHAPHRATHTTCHVPHRTTRTRPIAHCTPWTPHHRLCATRRTPLAARRAPHAARSTQHAARHAPHTAHRAPCTHRVRRCGHATAATPPPPPTAAEPAAIGAAVAAGR